MAGEGGGGREASGAEPTLTAVLLSHSPHCYDDKAVNKKPQLSRARDWEPATRLCGLTIATFSSAWGILCAGYIGA